MNGKTEKQKSVGSWIKFSNLQVFKTFQVKFQDNVEVSLLVAYEERSMVLRLKLSRSSRLEVLFNKTIDITVIWKSYSARFRIIQIAATITDTFFGEVANPGLQDYLKRTPRVGVSCLFFSAKLFNRVIPKKHHWTATSELVQKKRLKIGVFRNPCKHLRWWNNTCINNLLIRLTIEKFHRSNFKYFYLEISTSYDTP